MIIDYRYKKIWDKTKKTSNFLWSKNVKIKKRIINRIYYLEDDLGVSLGLISLNCDKSGSFLFMWTWIVGLMKTVPPKPGGKPNGDDKRFCWDEGLIWLADEEKRTIGLAMSGLVMLQLLTELATEDAIILDDDDDDDDNEDETRFKLDCSLRTGLFCCWIILLISMKEGGEVVVFVMWVGVQCGTGGWLLIGRMFLGVLGVADLLGGELFDNELVGDVCRPPHVECSDEYEGELLARALLIARRIPLVLLLLLLSSSNNVDDTFEFSSIISMISSLFCRVDTPAAAEDVVSNVTVFDLLGVIVWLDLAPDFSLSALCCIWYASLSRTSCCSLANFNLSIVILEKFSEL